MTEPSGREDVAEVIRELRTRVEYVEEMLDSEKRLVRSARLVERVIKQHFMRNSGEKKGLGALIQMRKQFLGQQRFEDAAYAVNIRNHISHFVSDGEPTDEEMRKASDVFLGVVRLHVEELEQRTSSANARSEKFEEEEPDPIDTISTEGEPEPSPRENPPSYATQVAGKPMPLLDALDSDPWLSASTIAEYTFCPRAGVLTHEGGYSDAEEEMPSLSLLPWYELSKIEEDFSQSWRRLFWLMIGFFAGLVILLLSPLVKLSVFPLLLLAAALGWLKMVVQEYKTWKTLSVRRLAAILADDCEPDPNSTQQQDVNWWGLLRAGFEVRRPKKALKDERWKLTGKPRRILQKGGMTVPVHRIRKAEGSILPQHIVRVMAHCHLIEAEEGAVCPYAIILFGDTYAGITIPNIRENRDKFYSVLERVRAKIQQSEAAEWQPPEPASRTIYIKCPHGCRRPVVQEIKTYRYEEPLDPFLLANRKGRLFHSSCGDRFRWKPYHERNEPLVSLE